MRRPVALLFLILSLVGCSREQEPAPTPPTSATGTTVTSTATTSTGAPTTTAPTTTTTLAPLEGLAYEEVATADFPVQMTALAGSPISYLATKDGRVWAYDGEAVGDQAVLDIADAVRNQGEQGLLSIVVHPEDATRLFAHYSDGDGDTVVSEFTLVSPTEADRRSERVMVTLDQPAPNHNGGMLQFGPDGGLYLGLGDGGGSSDRFGNGQNPDTLLGGLVRLDVDAPDAEALLFQMGLRNPWRFWIDGDLIFIADVGQNAFEEVNVAPLEEGVNYGWPITEGLHCFRPTSGCDTDGLTLPLVEVAHGDAGTCSITGGVVYRGQAIPELDGHFLYSDYCGGYLRSFLHQGGRVIAEIDWTDQVGVPGRVPGFGIDGAGEPYVMTTDRVLRLVPVRG